jgi:transposase
VCVGHYRNKRTLCHLTDITRRQVLELLPRSTELELARFLKQLPKPENLKIVVIDMARGFFHVIKKLFPGVHIVIDPYHVLRLLNEAITAVVRIKQDHLSAAEHEELMAGGNRFLLLKRRFSLTEEEKKQLARWFERVPLFRQAYDLKEEVYDIWRCANRREAEERYDAWLRKVPEALVEPFNSFTGAVKRWRPYVFNYFDHKVTNAYTESRNRDVKTLQREGRRLSFSVLRARLIYGDRLRNAQPTKSKHYPAHIRKAMKEARERRRSVNLRDPDSYIAKLERARKSRNEFSRLLRPPQGWEERFSHYSCYSEEKSPAKWGDLT